MRILKELREKIENIRWEDAADPSRWVKFARGQLRLYFYILRELVRNRCPQQAAALTFTTLLSLVPLLAVAFSFFRGFAAMDGLADRAQNAIFQTILARPLTAGVEPVEEDVEAAQTLVDTASASAEELLAAADSRPRRRAVAGSLQLYLEALGRGADAGSVRRGMSTLYYKAANHSWSEVFRALGGRARGAYFAVAELPPDAGQRVKRNTPPEGVREHERAVATLDVGKHAEAVAALRSAEEAGYPVVESRAEIGLAYRGMADRLAAQGQLSEALEGRRAALLYHLDAVLLSSLHDSRYLDEAVRHHNDALQELGEALLEMGKLQADLYRDLREQAGADAEQVLERSVARLSEAIVVLEHSSRAHEALGEVLEDAQRWQAASHEYKTAWRKSKEAAVRGISVVLVDYIRLFIDKVGRAEIGILGILILLVTATSLLNTIEKTLNHIWKVTERRPFWIKFTSFCTLIWLGPALIGASIWGRERLWAYVQATFGDVPVLGGAVGVLTVAGRHVIPFITIWLILMALYKFLPHTRVRFASVAWGAFLAAVLLHGARPLFTLYVVKAVKYQKIYGSLGVVPIFLLWIWLLWLIALFGAEVAFTIQNVGLLRYKDKLHRLSSVFIDRYLAARIMMYVAREFWDTGKPVRAARLAGIMQITPEEAADAAGRLVRLGLLTPVGEESDEFHPARDLSKLKLSEVLSITDRFRDESRSVDPQDKPYEDKLETAFRSAIEAQGQALEDMTFRDLLLASETDRDKWPKRSPGPDEP